MDIDAANNARDARLRKRLLLALDRAQVGPLGGLNARTLVEVAGTGPRGQAVEDDDHAIALLRYLVNAGYATERDERTHKRQRFGLEWMFLKVTPAGSRLAVGKGPIDPLIEDDRRDGSEAD
jgi:hypothetical protein